MLAIQFQLYDQPALNYVKTNLVTNISDKRTHLLFSKISILNPFEHNTTSGYKTNVQKLKWMIIQFKYSCLASKNFYFHFNINAFTLLY